MNPSLIADIQSQVSSLSPHHLAALERRLEWLATARPDQLPPEVYYIWALIAGRGAGKTRSGAEDVWWGAFVEPQRIAVVGPTLPDVRKTAFEGESGLLARIPEGLVQNYNRTSLELWTTTLTGETSYYVGYSSQEPERFRGPQHHRAWCDELGAWPKKTASDTWDNLLFGLRLGHSPSIVITTTPRTTPLLRQILADVETIVSRASTFANTHLPESTLRRLRQKYEGTRLGKQELHAQMLEDVVGAMWVADMFSRIPDEESSPVYERVVVAVDPSGATDKKTDTKSRAKDGEETDTIGIVVAGKVYGREEYHVLADVSVPNGGPSVWGKAVVDAYDDFEADCVVAEVNFGGGMVEAIIKNVDSGVNVETVRASRGKIMRAEPVAALYEQGKVRHAPGLDLLEDQLCLITNLGYQGDGSPDRADALVWALTKLSGGRRRRRSTELELDGGKRSGT